MFSLPQLPYTYSELEPYIDAATMEIHYSKHHAAYTDNLNSALTSLSDWKDRSIVYILQHLNDIPENLRSKVKNNAGGYYNHNLFWSYLTSPASFRLPQGELETAINKTFGDLSLLQEKLSSAALNQFGSGWAWLVSSYGRLEIISTSNQDSPISLKFEPLLGIDVWEHAYYLKYQNRRKDYIAAWWNIVNWSTVETQYQKLLSV